jgi:hypothetical protein
LPKTFHPGSPERWGVEPDGGDRPPSSPSRATGDGERRVAVDRARCCNGEFIDHLCPAQVMTDLEDMTEPDGEVVSRA